MCNKYCVFLLLLWAVPFFLQARTCLWRLASESGTDASVIAHIQPNGSGFQAIPFLSDVAAPPEGVQLLKASNGRCCGITQQDGSSGVGVLFEYGPAGSGSYVEKNRFDHTNANINLFSMLDNCGINSENYSGTLNDWSSNLIGTKDCTISGDGAE